MSENEKQTDPELEKEQREIRQRLIVRVAIAVGLIGAAAISLPLIDKFKSSTPEVAINPPPASDEKTTRIIGAPPAKTEESAKPEEKPADKPAEVASNKDGDTKTETKPEAKPEAPPPAAQPESKTPPVAVHDPEATPAKPAANNKPAASADNRPPPPPQVASQPKPAPVTTLPNKPLQPEPLAPKNPPPAAVVAPSKPLAPVAPLPNDATPAKAPQVEAAPVVPRSKMGVGTGYTVQLGVFSNYDNAKALAQRLEANGIKAHLETRVQLGPFKDKQEAEEAYRKIKQMGLPAVLVGQ